MPAQITLSHNLQCIFDAACNEGTFYPRFCVAARKSLHPETNYIGQYTGALAWLNLAQSYCDFYSKRVHPIRLMAPDILALSLALCEYYEQHIREEDEFQAETLAEKATF